jgi:hypothetical protein
MLYRCLAVHKDINIQVIGSAAELNDKVLEKTSGEKWTQKKCESILDNIIEVLKASNSIMFGRNQHEKMGMYLYLNSLSNTKTVMKSLSSKTKKINFIDQYVIAKREAETGAGGKPPVVFHTDTAHNIKYTKAYIPVIKTACSKL